MRYSHLGASKAALLIRPGMMSMLSWLRRTNDHLQSTVHRVVNKQGRERYSIPFFFEPNFDTEVVYASNVFEKVYVVGRCRSAKGRFLENTWPFFVGDS